MESARLTQDSSAVFREVLERLPVAVYFVDTEEKILFWNDGAEKITGYLRQDVIGRFCRENILSTRTRGLVSEAGAALPAAAQGPTTEDDSEDSRSPFRRALRDGQVSEAEMFLHHQDGHRLPVRLRAFPIRDESGAVIAVAETFDASIGSTDWDRRLNRLSRYGALDEQIGVLSTSVMQTHLQESLLMFQRHRLPASVLLVEVCQFEQLVVKYGPLIAPAALRATAQTIESFIRPADFIGRWEDNQLLVILTECSPFELPAVLHKLRLRATPTELRWWGDYVALDLSFRGAAAQRGDTAEALLARADKAPGSEAAPLASRNASEAGGAAKA